MIDFVGHQKISKTCPVQKGGYLSCLEETGIVPLTEGLSAVSLANERLSVLELRGQAQQTREFHLHMEDCCFLLMFQLRGNLFLGGSICVGTERYGGCNTSACPLYCRLDAGKIWSIVFGLSNRRIEEIQHEWPLFGIQAQADNRVTNLDNTILHNIGYRHRQIFDKIQQIQNGPYSTLIKLEYQFMRLLELYHADLSDASKSKDLESVRIYRLAIDYILKHYMDADIDRNTIADKLSVSVRTLNRAFEGKGNNVTQSIRLIRIHKVRELLRTTDSTFDDIAFQLHYMDTKHLAKLYIKQFGYSPTMERKKRTKGDMEN